MFNAFECIKNLFAIIGALAAVGSIIWVIWNAVRSYLYIELKVEKSANHMVTAITSVENKHIFRKQIFCAFILIGPEEENPIETGKIILQDLGLALPIEHTNDLHVFSVFKQPWNGKDRMVIPLPFFYKEQVWIEDEILRYRCSIDIKNLEKGRSYSVRFFIFPKQPKMFRFLVFSGLHRSTQDLLVL